MARKPSVILTPAEQKMAFNATKVVAKDAATKHAAAVKARKQLEDTHEKAVQAANKAHLRAQAAREVEFQKAAKAADKVVKEAEKELTRANADHDRCKPKPDPVPAPPPPLPKAEPSPTA